MKRAVLALCLIGCEKPQREQEPPAPPGDAASDAGSDAAIDGAIDGAIVDAFENDTRFRIRYSARTDNALDGSNTTYFSIVEDESFFVVADAKNADTSKRVVEHMSELVANACRGEDAEAQMKCVTARAAKGKAVSYAAVLVRGDRALLASEGKVTAFNSRRARDPKIPGMRKVATIESPQFRWLELERGQTIVLIDQRSAAAIPADPLMRVIPDGEAEVPALDEALLRFGNETASARTRGATAIVVIHLVRPND